jgi:2-polyprenyl-3-methyl-5-hydroxy-6-metoxy-1,4-benzoquinol methylase
MPNDNGDIAFGDHSIAFFCRYARGRTVLDLGCVNHNPENYKSRYWLHKALDAVAQKCLGLDLLAEGVSYLKGRGYEIVEGNAENFDLGETFEVIVAGELIEHLGNPSGFLESAKRHLAPNGVLLISTPNPWYWRFFVKSWFSPNVKPNPEHTCWFCVETLRTLLARHELEIVDLSYGSRYWRDRLMPLPTCIKHTTFQVAVIRKEKLANPK